jgi:hypothetical protein
MNWKNTDWEVMEDELTEFDQDHYQWCEAIRAEYKAVANERDEDDLLNVAFLEQHSPMLYKNLQEAAEQEQQTLEEHLASYDTPLGYFEDVMSYCYDEIKLAEQRPLVLEIAQTVSNKRAVLQNGLLAMHWQNIR